MTVTVITPLPAAPNRSQGDAGYSGTADTWAAAIDPWTSQVNALGGELEIIGDDTRDAANAVAVIIGNSVTPLTVANGPQTMTIETGKSFAIGHNVKVSANASPLVNYMLGVVTGYDSGTGVLNVTMTVAIGTATLSAWTVTITTDSVTFEQAHAIALLF